MGVDWITCGICKENFPDCGLFGYCSYCETALCSTCHDKQVEKYGHPDPGSDAADNYGESSSAKCDLCSGLMIYDEDLLAYLLKKTGMTKEQVEDAIKKEREYE